MMGTHSVRAGRESNFRRRVGSIAGLLGLIIALGVMACEGGTGPDPDGNNGDGDGDTAIRATVTLDGSPEGGVTVRLFEEGGETALETLQTESDGRATFGDLDEGSYDVEVEVPSDAELGSGETARKTVSAQEGQTSSVSFSLSSGENGGNGDVVEVRLTSSWQFEPSTVTISPGTTVRWINDDSSAGHTVTPREHDEWQSVSMTTQGQVFEHTFDDTGDFPYFCQPHESSGMTGTVVVQ